MSSVLTSVGNGKLQSVNNLASKTVAWRARDEERLLLKNLSGYEDYCQLVQYRLVPFVW